MEDLALAKRLGPLTALPMVPWMLPMPDLSECLFRHTAAVLSRLPGERPPPGYLARLGRALATAGARPAWSTRFAPT
jgi:hypothetical protein